MKKGFTLIELLVVIAIIGILSSVVLTSLNLARDKGADGAIKADLAGVRSQAEIYYDSNNDYALDFPLGNCPNSGTGSGSIFELDTVALAQIDDAEFKSGGNTAQCVAGNALGGIPDGTSPATTWAISITLKTPGAGDWCIDSIGGVKSGTAGYDGSNNAVCL